MIAGGGIRMASCRTGIVGITDDGIFWETHKKLIKLIWDEIKDMFVGLFYYALFLIILGFALFGGV